MNQQEIFNKVRNHLLTQNQKSIHPINRPDGSPNCQYKTETGLMCAIGCLFPEGFDTSEVEGCYAGNERVVSILLNSGILEKRSSRIINLLVELQRIHDSYNVSYWPEKLKEIAAEYKLTVE
jgi:hypothetical protein